MVRDDRVVGVKDVRPKEKGKRKWYTSCLRLLGWEEIS
jgi:hypothetical protein